MLRVIAAWRCRYQNQNTLHVFHASKHENSFREQKIEAFFRYTVRDLLSLFFCQCGWQENPNMSIFFVTDNGTVLSLSDGEKQVPLELSQKCLCFP